MVYCWISVIRNVDFLTTPFKMSPEIVASCAYVFLYYSMYNVQGVYLVLKYSLFKYTFIQLEIRKFLNVRKYLAAANSGGICSLCLVVH